MADADALVKIIRGGLDRLADPKAAHNWVVSEVRGLGLAPNTGDKTTNSIIRLINKVVSADD